VVQQGLPSISVLAIASLDKNNRWQAETVDIVRLGEDSMLMSLGALTVTLYNEALMTSEDYSKSNPESGRNSLMGFAMGLTNRNIDDAKDLVAGHPF